MQTIRDGITTLRLPSMLGVFVEQAGLEACASLRRVIASGEALPWALVERFYERLPGVELHNLYGPTEASVDVTSWACRAGDARQVVPIGRPIGNLQAYVLDGRLEPSPIGVPGELYLGGVGLGRGYLQRADLTAERFVPDPFGGVPGGRLYKTGDLARWLADGSLEYLGRLDFQVKIRGHRIELGEIESALRSHAEVRDAVVTARDEGGRKYLAAYVVPRDGQTPSVEALRRYLGARLPEAMVPGVYVPLETLPLSATGKVDRKRLPAPAGGRSSVQAAYVAPRTAWERELAAIWQRVLGVEQVGVRDNFFALGGDSIRSIQVLSAAKEQQLGLTLEDLFRQQTIEELAVVAAGKTGEAPAERTAA